MIHPRFRPQLSRTQRSVVSGSVNSWCVMIAPMPAQKWDYALVQVNIKTFKSLDGTPLHAELGQLGEKGWELVTTERMIGDDVVLIFKRPR